jgi:hypothetical protein
MMIKKFSLKRKELGIQGGILAREDERKKRKFSNSELRQSSG